MLNVYTRVVSLRYPELVYHVNPVRATVVKQGTASRLSVSFDGKGINQDVTAVQLAIWNRGKEPIKEVRKPVVIRTDVKAPILEATVRKTNRDVVKLTLDQTRIAEGELGVTWNELEKDDGGVVQIIYAGGLDVRIQGSGVIEGQPEIRELRYAGYIQSPAEQMRWDRRLRFLWLVISLLFIWNAFLEFKIQRQLGFRVLNRRILLVIFAFLTVIFILAWAWTALTIDPGPPFGFE